jgi:hypothetical protein
VTEARERPEYGEYATPEEQAEAMGTPTAPFVEAAIVEPAALAEASAAIVTPQPRRWDLVLTIALVVLGAYGVFNGFASNADLAYSITQAYTALGYDGQFPDIERANAVGLTLNIVQPILLALAVLLSGLSLRRGRVTFYIPLAAGVLSTIVSGILLMTLIYSDPGFWAFAQTMGV